MKELSLHILDIVQNSITANSSFIQIIITEDTKVDVLEIKIIDNGKGMTPELLEKVTNPFTTTRTTRKVGLGIPLFKNAALLCEGDLEIKSELGVGTEVKVLFKHNHIDRAPLGDMVDTIVSLVLCNPNIDFLYRHTFNGTEFVLDTREIKKIISGVEINCNEVISWIREYLKENINILYGGVSD
jgi:hypothetical protein